MPKITKSKKVHASFVDELKANFSKLYREKQRKERECAKAMRKNASDAEYRELYAKPYGLACKKLALAELMILRDEEKLHGSCEVVTDDIVDMNGFEHRAQGLDMEDMDVIGSDLDREFECMVTSDGNVVRKDCNDDEEDNESSDEEDADPVTQLRKELKHAKRLVQQTTNMEIRRRYQKLVQQKEAELKQLE